MSTSYPGGLDALTNPVSTDPLSNPSHSDQHINANDAIEAIQAELGTDPAGSAATVKARLTAIEQPSCIIVRRGTSAQSLANNTLTTVIFNEVVREDDEDGALTHATGTGILTVNTTGWYALAANIQWGSSSTGERFMRMFAGGNEVARISHGSPIGNAGFGVAALVYLTAAQTVYVEARQQSGGALDVNSTTATNLSAYRVR